jgi:hypothetical protein
MWYEGLTTTKNLLGDIKAKILNPYDVAEGTNQWVLLSELADAQLKLQKLTVKGVTALGKEIFLSLDNNLFNMKSIEVQSAEIMDAGGVMTNPSVKATMNFVKPTSIAPRDVNTPISYWLSVSNERIVLFLQGDPTVDFSGYVKNMLYFGAMKPLDPLDDTDICLTVGSEAVVASTLYGTNTSESVTTIAVLKTKSGVFWQKHYGAFITQQSTLPLEVSGFNASRWTGKYHLSPIYVVHPYDGYRGTLDGVIAIDKNNILHLDELLVDTADVAKKDRYKYFDLNTTNDFITTTPNPSEGVACIKAFGVAG